VLAKAVGCGRLSTGGVWRRPDAGGVKRPPSRLFWGLVTPLLLEGVALLPAGELRAAEMLRNEGWLDLRQLPQAAAIGPTA